MVRTSIKQHNATFWQTWLRGSFVGRDSYMVWFSRKREVWNSVEDLQAPDCNIESSDVQYVCDSTKILPMYILCRNGDVLKKKKRRKVLVYPSFKQNTFSHMYCRVLLFYPLQSEEEILDDGIDRKFFHTFEDSGETFIDRNEK